jgi:cyclic-di-GMP phosphodiesterase TipF (flagellum assembly factor)
MRLGALFVAVCMTVIAASAGVVVYFTYGFTGAEAIIVAIAALTALALYNAVSTRVNIRTVVGPQLVDLSRSNADIARQLAETGRRLATVETKLERSLVKREAATEPLALEISELGALVDQLAGSLARQEARLAAMEQSRAEAQRLSRPAAPKLEPQPTEAPEPPTGEPPRPFLTAPEPPPAAKPEAARPEPPRPEPPKAQAPKPEAPKVEAPETPKLETLKALLTEFRMAQRLQGEKPDSPKGEPPRAESSPRQGLPEGSVAAPAAAPTTAHATNRAASESAPAVEPAAPHSQAAPAVAPSVVPLAVTNGAPAPSGPSAIAARERLEADSAATREMQAAVRAAVEANRVDLHLQPIVSLPQRKVRFYEAMSRLRTQDGDVVMAAEFISQAEAGGLMPKIDNLVVFRCVQVLRRLLLKNREVGVFCNLSLATLTDAVVFPQLLEFLDANRAIAPSLVLEFTQSGLRGAGPIETESLAALRACGYSFSVDNVTDMRIEPRELAGRGFRFVKLRANLILNRGGVSADIHPGDLPDLLGRYGIDLVAERIESEGMVVDLLDYDVKFGQGFLFSPPRPVRAEALQGAAEHNVARDTGAGGGGGLASRSAGGAPAQAGTGLRSAGLTRVARRI